MPKPVFHAQSMVVVRELIELTDNARAMWERKRRAAESWGLEPPASPIGWAVEKERLDRDFGELISDWTDAQRVELVKRSSTIAGATEYVGPMTVKEHEAFRDLLGGALYTIQERESIIDGAHGM